MTRSSQDQLSTANWLLAMFNAQIAEFDDTGAHAHRIEQLRAGKATWEQHVADLRKGDQ